MHDRDALPQVIRFGPFALDVRVRELRKGPTRLKVPDQSIEILTALLERPGNLVTREELRQRLWPADTFVDFERGLNAAVWRLREALGDAADAPRFVETLPRRGYRFIGPIDDGRPATAGDQSSDTTARAAPASAEDARRVTQLYASLWRQAIVDQERAWKAYHHERELHRDIDSRTFWDWLGRIRRTLKL